MNTLTAVFTAIVLGAAIGFNSSAAQADNTALIGPPPAYDSGDNIEVGGPPPTLDGGDTPVCFSCD